MQKVVSSAVHEDLLQRVEMIETRAPSRLPILPGADQPWEPDELAPRANPNAWDIETLDQALCEMERASKKGNVAKTVCFQLISEM